MTEISRSNGTVDIQQTLLDTVLKELRRLYELVDVHPGSGDGPTSNQPEGMQRIVIRWYDNAPLARILFAADYLIVELGPRRAEGWKRVARIRYQDPTSIERIIELVQQADL